MDQDIGFSSGSTACCNANTVERDYHQTGGKSFRILTF